jgi:hypothetical protein
MTDASGNVVAFDSTGVYLGMSPLLSILWVYKKFLADI